VNGDGLGDIVIGARYAEPRGDYSRNPGETYVVFGSTQAFPAVLPLTSLLPGGGGDGSRGFVLTGVDMDELSGYAVSAAGDINGDGFDDLIIGAPYARDGAGAAYVVFGSPDRFPAVLPLATLYPGSGGDGTRGFVLVGARDPDRSGNSVSAAGDVNADGIDDFLVCAHTAGPGGRVGAGETYVVFGAAEGFTPVFPLAVLFPSGGGNGTRGFVFTGIDIDDGPRGSVSAAGDVNGDGIGDLVIGAPDANPNEGSDAGEIYVVFGSTQAFPAVFPLASLYPAGGGDGSRGFVLTGRDEGDYAGSSVSTAGDVNGDGLGDLIIGAERGGWAARGETFVVFGSAQDFPAVVPLASLFPQGGGDGSRGFVLSGVDNVDESGTSVSEAGDVNADGIGDIIIGGPFADPGGRIDSGESYVVFGRNAAH
jgi:hypothetical protein